MRERNQTGIILIQNETTGKAEQIRPTNLINKGRVIFYSYHPVPIRQEPSQNTARSPQNVSNNAVLLSCLFSVRFLICL